MIEENANVSIGTCYAGMAVGIVLCAGEAVLCKFAENYFTRELATGTPFTFDGSKEMIRLGILTICIPIATQIVASIIYGIFKLAQIDVAPVESNAFSSGSVGLGIMFIVSGLLCRHGAEVSQNVTQENQEKQDILE